MKRVQKFFIAQVGRTHGVHGDLKIYLYTDFPEQFKVGCSFDSSIGRLEISRINFKNNTIAFKGYSGIDNAKRLTNVKLYASLEETRERCKLNEGEYFWFDLEGCSVIEKSEILGIVQEMQRFADIDYFYIKTDSFLVKEGMAKSFFIPNIKKYILFIDIKRKSILVNHAKEILKAS